MKKSAILILLFLITSCVSMKGTEVTKGRTHFKDVKLINSDKNKNESLTFYKTFTSATSNKNYDV